MSKLLKALLTYQAILLLVCYSVVAFIKWDFNPNNWQEETRAGVALCCISLQFLNLIIYKEFKE